MTLKEILADAEATFTTKWNTREGRKIPDSDAINLGNDAVTFSGTVLYADLRDSTGLVNGFKPWFAAKVFKSYLVGACRIIQNNGGEITAFDGDRVMAVFTGTKKNTSAARSALHISAFVEGLNRTLKKVYPKTSYVLRQSVGIDTSELFVAKTGIRNSNDLVWIGRAANYAAKLCALGEGEYTSHITEDVFSKLADHAKYGGQHKELMWEKSMWAERGIVVYRSSWVWGF